jgi:ketosteroid isomerase-like protein
LAVVLFIAVGGCQPAGSAGKSSDDASLVQHEIGALLDQYMRALLDKDVAALDRIWADDLTFVNPRGELLSKQNRMDNIKSGATAFKAIRESDRRIRTYGKAAVATFKVALDAQYSGQDSSADYLVTTAWAHRGDSWQMVAVHMTRIAQ